MPASRPADRAVTVFVTFAALYALGAARTVQGGDAGEFMTIAARGGVAHPSGYPLVTILMQAAAWIPIGTIPWRASLVSAFCAAGALAMLFRAVCTATGRSIAGWTAVVALGFSPIFWRYATVAEVFAGAALTASLVLCVAERVAGGWQGPRAAFTLGLAIATGVANHHTVAFLAPLAAYAFVRSLASWGSMGPHVLAVATGTATGSLPYLWLMRPGGAWHWGETSTLRGLVDHVLRRDYGTFNLTAESAPVAWWEHPWRFVTTLPSDFTVVFVGLAVVGVIAGRRRGLWWAVLGAIVTTGPAFFALFNVPAHDVGIVVAERFYVVPHLLVASLAGAGAGVVVPRAPRAFAAGLAVTALVAASLHAAHGSHARWTVLDDYARNLLDAVAPRALVLVESDTIFGALLYLQEAEQQRPDVIVFAPAMQRARWYRAHIRARHSDFEGLQAYAYAPLDQVVQASLPARPVYATFDVAARLPTRLPAFPESGLVMRVVDAPDAVPPPASIEAQMSHASESHRRGSWVTTQAAWRETWEGWVVNEYVASWRALAERMPAGADRERVMARACAIAPITCGH